jgi:hypothetical protein
MTTTPTPTPRVRGALPPPISLQHPLRPLPCVQASAPRRTVRTTTHTAAGDRGVRRQWVCAASTHNAANAAAAEGTDGMDRQGTHPLPQPLSDEVALWWLQDTPREHPIPTPPRKCPFHKTVACTPHFPSHPVFNADPPTGPLCTWVGTHTTKCNSDRSHGGAPAALAWGATYPTHARTHAPSLAGNAFDTSPHTIQV